MIKTFTQQDLVRYLYHETTEKEEREIDKALAADAELKAKYEELLELKDQLNEVHMEPSKAAVLNILAYSRSYNAQRK